MGTMDVMKKAGYAVKLVQSYLCGNAKGNEMKWIKDVIAAVAIVVCIALLVCCVPVQAMTPEDLVKGEVVETGVCGVDNQPVPCAEMKYEGKTYIIIFTREYSPLAIFEVTGQKPYNLSNKVPLWPRKEV